MIEIYRADTDRFSGVINDSGKLKTEDRELQDLWTSRVILYKAGPSKLLIPAKVQKSIPLSEADTATQVRHLGSKGFLCKLLRDD